MLKSEVRSWRCSQRQVPRIKDLAWSRYLPHRVRFGRSASSLSLRVQDSRIPYTTNNSGSVHAAVPELPTIHYSALCLVSSVLLVLPPCGRTLKRRKCRPRLAALRSPPNPAEEQKVKPYVPSRWQPRLRAGDDPGSNAGELTARRPILGLTMLAAFYGFVTMQLT